MQGSQLCQWNNYKILFSFNAVKFHRYNIEPAAFCTLVVLCRGSTLRCLEPVRGSKRGRPLHVEGTGAEMRPAMVSGTVTGDAAVSCWPIFFPVPRERPRSLCES